MARKHYLQVTDSHYEKASSNVAYFVASKAPQGVVNEKCDAAKPAENRSVSQNVAVKMGDTALELSPKTGELRPHMPARSIFVATSRTGETQIDLLAMWLKYCPIQLTDAQREAIRQIARGKGGV